MFTRGLVMLGRFLGGTYRVVTLVGVGFGEDSAVADEQRRLAREAEARL
jgi:hypothetical protein